MVRLRVRLYPTEKQKDVLKNHINAYKFCYNLSLSYKTLILKTLNIPIIL